MSQTAAPTSPSPSLAVWSTGDYRKIFDWAYLLAVGVRP